MTLVAIVLIVALVIAPRTVDNLISGAFDAPPPTPEPALWAAFERIAPACVAEPASGGCLQLYEILIELRKTQEQVETPTP